MSTSIEVQSQPGDEFEKITKNCSINDWRIIQNEVVEMVDITLFKSIAVFCGTNSSMQNIPHIHIEYEEYSA